jgi:hypothetical protein
MNPAIPAAEDRNIMKIALGSDHGGYALNADHQAAG